MPIAADPLVHRSDGTSLSTFLDVAAEQLLALTVVRFQSIAHDALRIPSFMDGCRSDILRVLRATLAASAAGSTEGAIRDKISRGWAGSSTLASSSPLPAAALSSVGAAAARAAAAMKDPAGVMAVEGAHLRDTTLARAAREYQLTEGRGWETRPGMTADEAMARLHHVEADHVLLRNLSRELLAAYTTLERNHADLSRVVERRDAAVAEQRTAYLRELGHLREQLRQLRSHGKCALPDAAFYSWCGDDVIAQRVEEERIRGAQERELDRLAHTNTLEALKNRAGHTEAEGRQRIAALEQECTSLRWHLEAERQERCRVEAELFTANVAIHWATRSGDDNPSGGAPDAPSEGRRSRSPRHLSPAPYVNRSPRLSIVGLAPHPSTASETSALNDNTANISNQPLLQSTASTVTLQGRKDVGCATSLSLPSSETARQPQPFQPARLTGNESALRRADSGGTAESAAFASVAPCAGRTLPTRTTKELVAAAKISGHRGHAATVSKVKSNRVERSKRDAVSRVPISSDASAMTPSAQFGAQSPPQDTAEMRALTEANVQQQKVMDGMKLYIGQLEAELRAALREHAAVQTALAAAQQSKTDPVSPVKVATFDTSCQTEAIQLSKQTQSEPPEPVGAEPAATVMNVPSVPGVSADNRSTLETGGDTPAAQASFATASVPAQNDPPGRSDGTTHVNHLSAMLQGAVAAAEAEERRLRAMQWKLLIHGAKHRRVSRGDARSDALLNEFATARLARNRVKCADAQHVAHEAWGTVLLVARFLAQSLSVSSGKEQLAEQHPSITGPRASDHRNVASRYLNHQPLGPLLEQRQRGTARQHVVTADASQGDVDVSRISAFDDPATLGGWSATHPAHLSFVSLGGDATAFPLDAGTADVVRSRHFSTRLPFRRQRQVPHPKESKQLPDNADGVAFWHPKDRSLLSDRGAKPAAVTVRPSSAQGIRALLQRPGSAPLHRPTGSTNTSATEVQPIFARPGRSLSALATRSVVVQPNTSSS